MITYMPVYASLALMTKKIVFEEIDVPRYIKALFIYWYAITYIASLFFFQETSVWLFYTFHNDELFSSLYCCGLLLF